MSLQSLTVGIDPKRNFYYWSVQEIETWPYLSPLKSTNHTVQDERSQDTLMKEAAALMNLTAKIQKYMSQNLDRWLGKDRLSKKKAKHPALTDITSVRDEVESIIKQDISTQETLHTYQAVHLTKDTFDHLIAIHDSARDNSIGTVVIGVKEEKSYSGTRLTLQIGSLVNPFKKPGDTIQQLSQIQAGLTSAKQSTALWAKDCPTDMEGTQGDPLNEAQSALDSASKWSSNWLTDHEIKGCGVTTVSMKTFEELEWLNSPVAKH